MVNLPMGHGFQIALSQKKRTGRLFFNTAEATEHAEAFGKDRRDGDDMVATLKYVEGRGGLNYKACRR
jgi:hypothetical protein